MIEEIRLSVNRGKPFGSDTWIQKIADKFSLKSTLNPRGRPKKNLTPFTTFTSINV
jgi:putative transposase